MKYSIIPTKNTYDNISRYLCTSQANDSIPSTILTQWKKIYSVREFEGQILLYHGEKKVVHEEELFDIVHRAHIELTGHGGRDVLMNTLREFYGVSKRVISIYLQTCAHCELKRARMKKGIEEGPSQGKPILEKDYAERYQADLIDMQSQKDGLFSWILVVEDHLTKFVHLRQNLVSSPEKRSTSNS